MKIVSPIVGWFIVIITPIFLFMTAIRIIFTPIYPQLEYRSPGFPPDSYGFTLQDRLYWSKISIDYILDKSILSLDGQDLPDGSPLYNERELSHMKDVKDVYRQMVRWWNGFLGLLILAGIYFNVSRTNRNSFGYYLNKGGWLTIFFIMTIIVLTLTSFNSLFTQFHRLFFRGDSWIFLYSDTLIRLFPIRFWQDAFILLGIISILEAGIFIWVGKKIRRQEIAS
jgi:integral membrane protein (TIGR01906 family)